MGFHLGVRGPKVVRGPNVTNLNLRVRRLGEGARRDRLVALSRSATSAHPHPLSTTDDETLL